MTPLNDKIFSHAYIAFIVKNNKGDSNPYHNNKHSLGVFYSCMMLFDMYRKEYGLKSRDKVILGLAALFHDFNHSGGKFKDDVNIKIALEGLHQYLEMEDLLDIYEETKSVLEATQYPYLDLDLNILQKIIRDADILYSISDHWLEIITSFASELHISLTEFIPMNIEHVENIQGNTPYCIEYLKKRKPYLKEESLKVLSRLGV